MKKSEEDLLAALASKPKEPAVVEMESSTGIYLTIEILLRKHCHDGY